MLTKLMSYNAQGQGMSGSDKDALVNEMRIRQPYMIVIMDDVDLAIRCKNVSPDTVVIHRDNRFGGNDDATHRMRPEDCLNGYRGQAALGLIPYIGNEFPFTAQAVDWLVQVAHLARQENIRVCLHNASGGQIGQAVIDSGIIDPLLAYMDFHYYAVHLYAAHSLTVTNDSTIPRRQIIIKRHDNLYGQTNRKWLAITEFGFDKVNGVGGGLNDIRAKGSSDEAIFDQMVVIHKVMQSEPILGTAWYCLGAVPNPSDAGFPGEHWLHYDIRQAPQLRQLIIDYQGIEPPDEESPVENNPPTIPVPDLSDFGGMQIRSTASWTNVRNQPSLQGQVITTIPSHFVDCTIAPDFKYGDWLPVGLTVNGKARFDLWVHSDYVMIRDPQVGLWDQLGISPEQRQVTLEVLRKIIARLERE